MHVNKLCTLTSAAYMTEVLPVKYIKVNVRSRAVIPLFLVHCLLLLIFCVSICLGPGHEVIKLLSYITQ